VVLSYGLHIEEAILQHQCSVKYDTVSTLYHPSSSGVTDALEKFEDCETLSKITRKISPILCLPQMKNSKGKHSLAAVTSQLFNDRKQKKIIRNTEKQKKSSKHGPKKTAYQPSSGKSEKSILPCSSSFSEDGLQAPVYDDSDDDSSLN
jgi:hypothetical protein